MNFARVKHHLVMEVACQRSQFKLIYFFAAIYFFVSFDFVGSAIGDEFQRFLTMLSGIMMMFLVFVFTVEQGFDNKLWLRFRPIRCWERVVANSLLFVAGALIPYLLVLTIFFRLSDAKLAAFAMVTLGTVTSYLMWYWLARYAGSWKVLIWGGIASLVMLGIIENFHSFIEDPEKGRGFGHWVSRLIMVVSMSLVWPLVGHRSTVIRVGLAFLAVVFGVSLSNSFPQVRGHSALAALNAERAPSSASLASLSQNDDDGLRLNLTFPQEV